MQNKAAHSLRYPDKGSYGILGPFLKGIGNDISPSLKLCPE
jgi:hypothetical protein